MENDSPREGRIVSFAHARAKRDVGDLFESVFRACMLLVEETASYLDKEGRRASQHLDVRLRVRYTACSMQLTTTLLDMASRVLIWRTYLNGDISAKEALTKFARVQATPLPTHDLDGLPVEFVSLLHKARVLHGRISPLALTAQHELEEKVKG